MSINEVSDRLKPVVLALARLLAVTERSFCAAFKPDVIIDSIRFSATPEGPGCVKQLPSDT